MLTALPASCAAVSPHRAVVAGGLTLVGALGLFIAYRVSGLRDRLTPRRLDTAQTGEDAVDSVLP